MDARFDRLPTQDPNRYSWEGLYVWHEPSRGRRLEWESDKWRYAKLALIPLIIVSAFWLKGLRYSAQSVVLLAGVSLFVVVLVWINRFSPRVIRIYKDKLRIERGGRGLGAAIYYSDVESVSVVTDGGEQRIDLIMKKGNRKILFCADHLGGVWLQNLFEARSKPNHLLEPTSPSVTPPAGAGGAPSVAADH